MILETSRLKLVPLGPEYAQDLWIVYSDADVARYVGGDSLAVESTREQTERCAREWAERGYGQSAVIWKETGRLVGRIGLSQWPEWNEVELGYALSRSAHCHNLSGFLSAARMAAYRRVCPDPSGSWPNEGGARAVGGSPWRSGEAFAATTPGSARSMTEISPAVRIPETPAAADAAQWVRDHTSPFIYHHSRRVFAFAMMHARLLGLEPDPELVYVSALFHDAGLLTPFSRTEQRFELDGADHARRFLLDRGFSTAAADVVWTAIALHTTPGVPTRMGPEIAVTTYGVLTDAIGYGLDLLDPAEVAAVTAADPRGDFKHEFLQTFVDALKDRPDTTFGTMNADVLAEFVPGFRRLSVVERVRSAAWPT
jgi:hypothetical protein